MLTLGRRALLALLAGTLLAAVGPAVADAAPTHWQLTYPFAVSSGKEIAMGQEITGPKKSISGGVGAGSEYQMRKLKWSGWGKGKATGRGRVRYCSDTCSAWRSARIVLDRRKGRTCGDAPAGTAPSVYYYTRFRLYGFEFIPNGTAHTAPHPC